MIKFYIFTEWYSCNKANYQLMLNHQFSMRRSCIWALFFILSLCNCRFEDIRALHGGIDGLDVVRDILHEVPKLLHNKG